MFGYVVADRSRLTEEALLRYQGCYCGLCRTIGQTYGHLQRAALNYDMTFLVLLLSSLYEPEERSGQGRCIAHPAAAKSYWQNEATSYAAAMNMALAYHNCMDDWHDDKKLKALALAKVFQGSVKAVSEAFPSQCRAIGDCMQALSRIEQDGLQEPDAGANAFGALMGELFVWKEDRWAPLLRQAGQALGRYIYLLDALLDLPEDVRAESYNPFRARYGQGLSKEDYLPVLKLLMGECTDAVERLPLLQDLELLRNILYSGVWTRFYEGDRKAGKEGNHV